MKRLSLTIPFSGALIVKRLAQLNSALASLLFISPYLLDLRFRQTAGAFAQTTLKYILL